MSIRAKVEDDTIKLPEGVHLPNGTEVTVEPILDVPEGRTFAERYAQFIGIYEGPGDLAENLDHYLYGAPKISQ